MIQCRSAIIGVTTYGVGCNPSISTPGVYAKITREVKTWINSMTSGTQDSDCDTEAQCEDCGLEQLGNKEEEVEKEEQKEKNTENWLVNAMQSTRENLGGGCLWGGRCW